MKILLINCKTYRRPNTNEHLLVQALEKMGHTVESLPWDDVGSNHNCDIAVIRLTWDYVERLEEFNAWLTKMEKAKFPIENPISTIRWNINKEYLLELEKKSVSVPKSYLWKGQYLPQWIEFEKTIGPAPYVFKPLISAGARGTFLVQGDVSYSAAIDRMQKAPFIAQKYLREVKNGEISLAFFDGKYSHAMKKVPQPGDFRVQAEYGGSVHPYEPSTNEIKWGEFVVEQSPGRPLIARVDYILSADKPYLMELEVFEPELFLDQHPKAAENLAKALVLRAR